MPDWPAVYERLHWRVEAAGVDVRDERLGPDTTGIFDGLSVTLNTVCDFETRCHALAHSFGHVAQWGLDYDKQKSLYDELHAAKLGGDAARLEAALARFRAYEEEASEYAAWLFIDTGSADAIPAFTEFARADIDAIVGFHRTGVMFDWPEFFAAWLARPDRPRHPFPPRPVPVFTPRAIEPQEVIQ